MWHLWCDVPGNGANLNPHIFVWFREHGSKAMSTLSLRDVEIQFFLVFVGY
jgi:hypothetical protein